MLKLIGKLTFKIFDIPKAISTYPLKSKYICKGKSKIALITSLPSAISGLSKMGSTKDAILSAKKIFLTKPTVNKKIQI